MDSIIHLAVLRDNLSCLILLILVLFIFVSILPPQLDCNFLEGRGHLLYVLKWPTGHNAMLGDKIGTGHWQKITQVSLRCLILKGQHSLWVMIFYTYVPNRIVLKAKLTSHYSKILRNYRLLLEFLNPLLKYKINFL